MGWDMYKLIKHYLICQRNKGTSHDIDLYLQLPILKSNWEDFSIDFILVLSRTHTGVDSIIMVIDCLSKMTHFITCKNTFDVNNIAKLLFKEIIWLHGIFPNIISDLDIKLVSSFWRKLWNLLGTDLRLSTAYHP